METRSFITLTIGQIYSSPTHREENNIKQKSVPQNKKVYCQNSCLDFCISKTCQGFKWIWADWKKPHLFPIKIIFMFQSISLVTLYPYLIVHIRCTVCLFLRPNIRLFKFNCCFYVRPLYIFTVSLTARHVMGAIIMI